jgi:hypothetical protein
MPKMTKEVYAGVQYDFSSEEGQIASSTTRVFRIIKSDVSEYINVSATCGVQIGQEHPSESGLYCASYSAQYDGDSRMVIVATFNYRTTPGGGDAGQDPGQFSPDIRPANWSISTTLTEAPAFEWKPFGDAVNQVIGGGPDWRAPVNPAGDRYEGVTKLVPISTITIEQFELIDPTRHSNLVGYINSAEFVIGTLTCPRHTVMFRGVSTQPALEQWGSVLYRGWKASYEFVFKRNLIHLDNNPNSSPVALGWDHAQIVEGINIINKNYGSIGAAAASDVWAGSLALKKKESEGGIATEIEGWPDNISIVENTEGSKVRGMILIGEGAKPTQRPCALPIALNPDGTPRFPFRTPPVLVYTYQVQDDYDFSNFGLRLT